MVKMSSMALLLISLVLTFDFFPVITSNDIDKDGLQTYIVHVQKPNQENFSLETDLESWYHSFLPENRVSRMVHSYRHVFSGFAARLTAEEVKAMESKPGFVSAHVENMLQLHTTHTPSFLGLHQSSGLWQDSNFGKGIIIGVIDTGITPNHPSFNDYGMPPPPAKWKGRCELEGTACNNKLIGARTFLITNETELPIDIEGHGTHTASTAAGNFVEGVAVDGTAYGNASGVAPLAHLAIYKVCNFTRDGGCPEGHVNAGIDAAIEDGVDVLSISLGVGFSLFYNNSVAISTYAAIRKGIFVSIAAGNFGSKKLVNDAPWLLTVGASTIDRSTYASVQLGNGVEYYGETISEHFPSEQLPLVYPGAADDFSPAALCSPGSLQSFDVKGKIVLCQRDEDSVFEDSATEVMGAGGAVMIFMNYEGFGDRTSTNEIHDLPAVHVSSGAGKSIKAYVNSTSSPTASLLFRGILTGIKPAPEVAFYSSRGPSRATPGILKPDIIGPGSKIIAAWKPPKDNVTDKEFKYAFGYGTSMATPHLSGVAALLKCTHPDWSPAAIKSAIMTTADTTNNEGQPILDHRGNPADFYSVGAGHVNPSKANQPGFVYDIQPDDYIPYLCGLNYTDQQVQTVVGREVKCAEVSSITEAELNYPSFVVNLGSHPQTYKRTVTNVGQTNSSYISNVVAPRGVQITVNPEIIWFTEKNQKVTYSLTLHRTMKNVPLTGQAYLSWVSSRHTVNSPIAISFQ